MATPDKQPGTDDDFHDRCDAHPEDEPATVAVNANSALELLDVEDDIARWKEDKRGPGARRACVVREWTHSHIPPHFLLQGATRRTTERKFSNCSTEKHDDLCSYIRCYCADRACPAKIDIGFNAETLKSLRQPNTTRPETVALQIVFKNGCRHLNKKKKLLPLPPPPPPPVAVAPSNGKVDSPPTQPQPLLPTGRLETETDDKTRTTAAPHDAAALLQPSVNNDDANNGDAAAAAHLAEKVLELQAQNKSLMTTNKNLVAENKALQAENKRLCSLFAAVPTTGIMHQPLSPSLLSPHQPSADTGATATAVNAPEAAPTTVEVVVVPTTTTNTVMVSYCAATDDEPKEKAAAAPPPIDAKADVDEASIEIMDAGPDDAIGGPDQLDKSTATTATATATTTTAAATEPTKQVLCNQQQQQQPKKISPEESDAPASVAVAPAITETQGDDDRNSNSTRKASSLKRNRLMTSLNLDESSSSSSSSKCRRKSPRLKAAVDKTSNSSSNSNNNNNPSAGSETKDAMMNSTEFLKNIFLDEELLAKLEEDDVRHAIEDWLLLRKVSLQLVKLREDKDAMDHFLNLAKDESRTDVTGINGGALQISLSREDSEAATEYFRKELDMTSNDICKALERRLMMEPELCDKYELESPSIIMYAGKCSRQSIHQDAKFPGLFGVMSLTLGFISCTEYYAMSDDDVPLMPSIDDLKNSNMFKGAPKSLFANMKKSKHVEELVREFGRLAFAHLDGKVSPGEAQLLEFWILRGSTPHHSPPSDGIRNVLFFSLRRKEDQKGEGYSGFTQHSRESFLGAACNFLRTDKDELAFFMKQFESIVCEEYGDGGAMDTTLHPNWRKVQKEAIQKGEQGH